MMHEIRFIKYHGCGNDYIYIDCMDAPKTKDEMSALAAKLSDRHFSVGGDGVVFIERGRDVDAVMRMFNADGSEGNMCGNAVRCIAKYIYDYKDVKRDELRVGTKSGVKRMAVTAKDGKLVSACVDMGAPKFDAKDIPANLEGEAVGRLLHIGGGEFAATLVSMGNPHCVIFVDDTAAYDVCGTGRRIECDPMFPDRINVEFVERLGKNRIRMRVFERGSGETLACGTGACAAAVALVKNGFAAPGDPIAVELLGGTLAIRYTGSTVFMDGPATEVFSGVIQV